MECGIRDFLSLKLVCRGFNEILTVHELAIAQKYLRRRRHGTLPSTTNNERTYTMNPEDDVVLLSDLFPPAKSAKGGHLYTFRYLHTLRRRQDICARLSYYLANRVMDNFCRSNQSLVKSRFPSKSERDLMFERGTAQLQFKLIPLTWVLFLACFTKAMLTYGVLLQVLRCVLLGDLCFCTKGTFESFTPRIRSRKAAGTHSFACAQGYVHSTTNQYPSLSSVQRYVDAYCHPPLYVFAYYVSSRYSGWSSWTFRAC